MKSQGRLLSILQSRVPLIEEILDLGYYEWNPTTTASSSTTNNKSNKHKKKATSSPKYLENYQIRVSDLVNHIHLESKPDPIRPLSELQAKCPKRFERAVKRYSYTVHGGFPHNPSFLVPLHVAIVHRHVAARDIDFVFGGSVLKYLAHQGRNTNAKYFAQLVPGTRIVVIQKQAQYTVDANDAGYQFERFVLGKKSLLVTPRTDPSSSMEHLQLVTFRSNTTDTDDTTQVVSCRILFAAECDGVLPSNYKDETNQGHHDDDDALAETPVEIKCNQHPQYDEIAWQMLASGSQTLIMGHKTKDSKSIQRVEQIPVADVWDQIPIERNQQLQTNVESALRSLQDYRDNSEILFNNDSSTTMWRLAFDRNGQLELIAPSLFPPEDVVHTLLSP